jgi:hypothetical protein
MEYAYLCTMNLDNKYTAGCVGYDNKVLLLAHFMNKGHIIISLIPMTENEYLEMGPHLNNKKEWD